MHREHSRKSEIAEILRETERNMKILPFGLFGDEGKERPTGGLVDAPSSKAVEEEGHSEKNCTLCPQFCNPLKHGGKEETEEYEEMEPPCPKVPQ